MIELASQIVGGMKSYFDSLLRKDSETGFLYLFDDELGDRASCCTTGLAASLYVLDGKMNSGGDGFEVARLLMEEVRKRQLPSGAFGQPFYVKKGDPDTIDIAEIGAVANSLYHVYKATGSEAAKESLLASANYLLTQVAAQNPGVVLKRPNGEFDVLNGDMYAAHTFGRAYELSGNPAYLEKVHHIFTHLADRFGKNEQGWWPYIENWDGSVFMGNSVLYQATILAFAHPALPLLDNSLRERWSMVSAEALNTMVQAIKQPPSEETEATWWTRDWSNGWELYLAFWRSASTPDIQLIGKARFIEVLEDIGDYGQELFRPKIQNDVPDRTPVTTTFRKAAGFVGIAANIVLDDWESEGQGEKVHFV
ncbi:hypothetical protein BK133_27080 [Paenibacillus sp. FSL H8-0548]|uniref:hypothetical protein n=1 Tax=Paenibacillus sp. FSL H8-0548 TaxID=1920422 RepID=UPI00096F9212|nr:hypothetical protein [Paenibacillus sp. FSL H8-0548]OMF22078.1 hypothetical protein BK133_27080 [Paenibacillus sp. FSL H8-0548]